MSESDRSTSQSELERSLGLKEALTIGVGTMIGAGIFIFPGLASGKAGMAATVSFALGGLISVLVAMCTSELATGIPRSGGTYYFVSEGLGKLPGALAGIGLWWGLVFASSFYLVGFGLYINQIFGELGVGFEVNARALGVSAAIALTVVNVLGTEKTGELQDVIVLILATLLTVFLSYGIIDATGIIGEARVSEEFAPEGLGPIFTTAALVYTSYLGFAQIANVAGEVKEPDKNLPRAMIGSVVIVAVLYIATIFVATSVLDYERLGELGETAMVEVGRGLWATVGAVVVLSGGLLATLSSANASILSSSRSVYALASDKLLPERASKVNEMLGTPVVSILMAGVPVVALVALGQVETLAEVASCLHLVLYGSMCLAVLLLRRSSPDWYSPSFQTPLYPFVPALGALASFALIAFMKPLSQLLAGGIIAAAALWYLAYRKWPHENG
jgi:amino acid transporter